MPIWVVIEIRTVGVDCIHAKFQILFCDGVSEPVKTVCCDSNNTLEKGGMAKTPALCARHRAIRQCVENGRQLAIHDKSVGASWRISTTQAAGDQPHKLNGPFSLAKCALPRKDAQACQLGKANHAFEVARKKFALPATIGQNQRNSHLEHSNRLIRSPCDCINDEISMSRCFWR